ALAAERNLREALRARDEFLSIASHELRTPITSMKLGVQVVKRAIERGAEDAFAPARIRKVIDQCDRQLGRLSRLIDDMLDISRINTGRLSLVLAETNADSLVREVIER